MTRTLVPRPLRVRVNRELDELAAHLPAYLLNVSASGALLRCRSVLPVGSTIDVNLTLVDEQRIETVLGTAEVVRHEANPTAMGVRFAHLEEPSRRALERVTAPWVDLDEVGA